MRRDRFSTMEIELIKATDTRVNERFCKCGVGVMEQHPELKDWWKCCICGYCKKKNGTIRRNSTIHS